MKLITILFLIVSFTLSVKAEVVKEIIVNNNDRISLNTIKTYELNTSLSSFFFAGVLFYLFFEVFFSFIRKIFLKISPLKPDKKHLHMLVHNWLRHTKNIKESNCLTSLLINLSYLALLLPLLHFQDNVLFSRYWFFLLIIFYTVIYIRLISFSKK